MKTKGLVVIVSAPSGAGKSTICARVLKRIPEAMYSVSVTTRRPRRGEIHGKSYFFVDEKRFRRLIADGKLLEWARVHGHYYGTPRDFIGENVARGKILMLDIDVQGAMKIKRGRLANAVYVFIMTPTFEILKKRLIGRGLDAEEVIRVRLKNARKELEYLDKYDYLIINDEVDAAVGKLEALITAERLKVSRQNRRTI
ncbi:MAG: guanylate kinase [Elusimicrobia bacterium HGW-Elusimicrobia-1]|jgi:guanylate kinase|nr:MAG: guanylate kinase [Elusimicrobia bacterium HGW-Elusimicrobia-1]